MFQQSFGDDLVWHLIYFTRLRFFLLIKIDLGSLLHLTRQHWISLFSLILPGNDDDGCPRTSDPDLSVSVSWKYQPSPLALSSHLT